MKGILLLIFAGLAFNSSAQFSVGPDNRCLFKDGRPFFWLGDTAWELFHRLGREDADRYLRHRSEQGFTVIQAVVLAEKDGLHKPNPYGHTPLIDDDPAKPNEEYFRHVDYIIDKAASYNINIALLPTWGDKVFKNQWGTGPEIFNEKNIAVYGEWIAKRYKDRKNVIWINGGDRNPRGEQDVAIWNALGNAIMKATDNKALITFHPQPAPLGSGQWFHKEKWLAFNMFQNGHCRDEPIYDMIRAAYDLKPDKPVMDGEPLYEDHPICGWAFEDLGLSTAYDMRKFAYLSIFAGAHGHTYGCHDVWQFYTPTSETTGKPNNYWYDALDLPGAKQMLFVKKLVETYPIVGRIPDQSVIRESSLSAGERIQATRGKDFAWIYSTMGMPFTVIDTKIKSTNLRAYWYSPRDGSAKDVELKNGGKNQRFIPPTFGYGRDWILVIDDASKHFVKPPPPVEE